MPSVFLAQQSEPSVAFGGLRVPPCTVSTDPEYGLTQNKPIQIGGSGAGIAGGLQEMAKPLLPLRQEWLVCGKS